MKPRSPAANPKKRVSILDISQKAGVSKGAAWAALSAKPGTVRLSEKTRAHIQEVARALDYRPNIVARGLASQKSFLLGVFFGEYNWSVSTQMVRAIQHECAKHDYSLVVYPARSLEEELTNLRIGMDRQLDGMLVAAFVSSARNNAATYARFAEEGMPISQMLYKVCPNTPFVGRDYHQIGHGAATYLIERGHTRIGLVTFPDYDKDDLAKPNHGLHYGGYLDAMTTAGLDPYVYPVRMHLGDCRDTMWTVDQGQEIADEVRRSSYAPTALVANCNSLGYGVIRGFQELGVRVPEDVSVVGCANDLYLPHCMVPSLTYFPVGFDAIGRTAVQQCLNVADPPLAQEIRLPSNVVEGKTVTSL